MLQTKQQGELVGEVGRKSPTEVGHPASLMPATLALSKQYSIFYSLAYTSYNSVWTVQ